MAPPQLQEGCAVAYHEERNTVLLHGGRGLEGVTYSDTWEWDGSNWKQLETESDYKVDHHQMVYVASDHLILAFGGWTGAGVSGDTWTWTGEWVKSEKASPPKRASFAITYDNVADKVNLFGGLWINGQYADLWNGRRVNGMSWEAPMTIHPWITMP